MAEAAEYQNSIPHFLENFLSKFDTAIPKGAQWILYFDFNELNTVTDTIITTLKQREPGEWWDTQAIREIADSLNSETLQKNKGCLFAQAVELPSENIVTNPEGLQYNGYIRTATGNGRGDYSNGVRIAFLETNYSFVDTIIRPWVITTGHLGLIARPDTEYRCTIHVCKLGFRDGPVYSPLTPETEAGIRPPIDSLDRKTQQSTNVLLKAGTPPEILQRYTFYGACPISITGEEYNYAPVTSPVIRETTFLYNYYSVSR